jgi:hypothetical protein
MPEVSEVLQNFEGQEVDDLDIDSKISSFALILLPYNLSWLISTLVLTLEYAIQVCETIDYC